MQVHVTVGFCAEVANWNNGAVPQATQTAFVLVLQGTAALNAEFVERSMLIPQRFYVPEGFKHFL